MKTCKKCGFEKDLTDFPIERRVKDGRGARCRKCLGEAVASWRRRNPKKRYEYRKKYVEKYRDKVYQNNKNHAARKKGAVGTISLKEWRSIKRIYRYRCCYCGTPGPLTQDHVIPLSRGGSNQIGNIVPACRSCNSRKNDRYLSEWKLELVKERG